MKRFDDDGHEFVDVECTCYAATPKAVLLSKEGQSEDRTVWLPKSTVQLDGLRKGQSGTVAIRRWIAKREGLL